MFEGLMAVSVFINSLASLPREISVNFQKWRRLDDEPSLCRNAQQDFANNKYFPANTFSTQIEMYIEATQCQ